MWQRVSVSVVEARQKTAPHTVRPRRRTRRRSLVPSRTRCRRTPSIGVAGVDVSVQLNVGHRTTAHSTRLEALHGRPSRALFERVHCSKSVVGLRGTVDANKPARNSRAHANCSVLSLTRMFLRETTTPQTEHNCSVARGQYTGETRDVTHVRTATSPSAAGLCRSELSAKASAATMYTCTPKVN